MEFLLSLHQFIEFFWLLNAYFIRSRFYMFVDDDYYVSTRNLLRFLRNPVNFPKYLGGRVNDKRHICSEKSVWDMLFIAELS